MQDAIVHAKPRALAIAGVVPFVIAVIALSTPSLAPLFPVAIFAGVAMVLLWCWTVGRALNGRIDADRRPALGTFRLSILFSLTYLALFLGTTFGLSRSIMPSPASLFGLHFFAMLAMLKVLNFVGTNLTLAEDQSSGSTDPPWSTTVTLLSIAGILPVQRRVNRIFGESR